MFSTCPSIRSSVHPFVRALPNLRTCYFERILMPAVSTSGSTGSTLGVKKSKVNVTRAEIGHTKIPFGKISQELSDEV